MTHTMRQETGGRRQPALTQPQAGLFTMLWTCSVPLGASSSAGTKFASTAESPQALCSRAAGQCADQKELRDSYINAPVKFKVSVSPQNPSHRHCVPSSTVVTLVARLGMDEHLSPVVAALPRP